MEGVTLANNVDAVLDQIEAQQAIELPENGTSLDLLQQVYRNPSLPLTTRMRAATAALPHEHPKLAVTTVVNAGDFADQLERAVERSRMIEAKPIIEASDTANVSSDTSDTSSDSRRPHVQASNGGKPTIIDRRYRKW
jgi:hypothetical protein